MSESVTLSQPPQLTLNREELLLWFSSAVLVVRWKFILLESGGEAALDTEFRVN